MEMCTLEYFGVPTGLRATIPSLEDHINEIADFLKRVGVTNLPEVESPMSDNGFWKEVVYKKVGKGNEKQQQ